MITHEAVNKAILFILEHIDEEISIEDVASHCHFSKYYFSRLFKEETGESLYQFMKRVKLEQGAFQLKSARDKSITEIGTEYGYSASNYSSAFKQHHRMSPAEFREGAFLRSQTHPTFPDMDVHLDTPEECAAKTTIEILPDYHVLYQRNIGHYKDLSADWRAFLEMYQDEVTDETLFIERTFDDPTITDGGQCLYELCMTVPPSCSLENTYKIEGGKFAVYHFKGSVADIFGAYQSIFNVWMQYTGNIFDKRYSFEIYRKMSVDALHMEIDICVPIQ